MRLSEKYSFNEHIHSHDGKDSGITSLIMFNKHLDAFVRALLL